MSAILEQPDDTGVFSPRPNQPSGLPDTQALPIKFPDGSGPALYTVTGYDEPDSALELFTSTAKKRLPQPSSTQDRSHRTPAPPDSFMRTSPTLCGLSFHKIRRWDPSQLPPRRLRALSLPRVSFVVPSCCGWGAISLCPDSVSPLRAGYSSRS